MVRLTPPPLDDECPCAWGGGGGRGVLVLGVHVTHSTLEMHTGTDTLHFDYVIGMHVCHWCNDTSRPIIFSSFFNLVLSVVSMSKCITQEENPRMSMSRALRALVAQQVAVKMHDKRWVLPKKPHRGDFITAVSFIVSNGNHPLGKDIWGVQSARQAEMIPIPFLESRAISLKSRGTGKENC